MQIRSINSFRPLYRELRDRLLNPVGSVTFWIYALLGIGVFGGIAIWLELAKYAFGLAGVTNTDNLRLAVITYSPAVGCAAAQQMFLAEKDKTYLRSFAFLITFCFLALCAIALLLERNHQIWSMIFGIVGFVGAIAMWWVANGSDTTFHDLDPAAPVGGSTNTSLPGDVTGFRI
jgi:hypothetical protein